MPPAVTLTKSVSVKREERDPTNKPIRVVVVEDNCDDSDLLVRQLHKNNFDGHIRVISDGKEALNLLLMEALQLNLAAIFLDLSLPSLSGIKLLAQIRSRPGLSNIPVYVMTSSNDPAVLKECERLGIDGLITKPVTYLAFAKAVADLFHARAPQNLNRIE
jgi:CheY-like chemotaxis protein